MDGNWMNVVHASFSTEELSPNKQFDAWRGWFGTVFNAVIDEPEAGFVATCETWNFGGFGLSRVQAPRLQAIRSAGLIRQNPIDHWNIAVGRKRTAGEVGGHRAIDVPAGVPYVSSLGRTLTSARDDDERVQLYLPRDSFPELAAVLDGMDGRAIPGAMGQLLGDFLVLLARNAPACSGANAPALQSAVRGMVLACIAPSKDSAAQAATPIAVVRKDGVRKIIDQNLHRLAFGPDFLCREAGMSRSQLYRLLEAEGGVKNYIQRRRLKKCYSELSRGTNLRPIAAIGEEMGFADPSGFTRAFKKEFGMSPSEVRATQFMHSMSSPNPQGLPRQRINGLRDILEKMA